MYYRAYNYVTYTTNLNFYTFYSIGAEHNTYKKVENSSNIFIIQVT